MVSTIILQSKFEVQAVATAMFRCLAVLTLFLIAHRVPRFLSILVGENITSPLKQEKCSCCECKPNQYPITMKESRGIICLCKKMKYVKFCSINVAQAVFAK
jgi:hypothetical protein